ncbi:MAG: NAD(P)/FAD-dependent oxidoreductase [Planctomycetales bacterium]|nr:NAD(P)/FAD-dependent oxidoreductase [Planctomycetales bacterium]
MSDLIVVGAGAAGLMAAVRAAELGVSVLLLEKNSKPGVKILMSGGTRCNLTHATDRRGIVEAFGTNGKFLHSALAALSPQDVVAFFNAADVPTKVEETGKIFPASDRALDVQRALVGKLRDRNVELCLNESVREIAPDGSGFRIVTDKRVLVTHRALVTTGGQSYPGCGTTGDGYAWLETLGHRIVPPRPALVPLTTNVAWVRELQGVTLPDVELKLVREGLKKPPRRRGSLLFTHFGMSGPVTLDLSRYVSESPQAGWGVECDFLPDLCEDRLRDELTSDPKRSLGAVAQSWVPRRLWEALMQANEIDSTTRVAECAKSQRQRMLVAFKRQRVSLSGTLGFKKAEVTAGGVDLKQIDSRTMQSKICPGLYLAGEILDLDGPIGGFNFQAAFSTGWLAAQAVAASLTSESVG